MQILLSYFLLFLFLTFVLTLHVRNENSVLAKIVLDVQDRYQTHSIVVAMSNIYEYTAEAITASILTQYFSEKNLFSMIITFQDLSEAIDYYYTNNVHPFHVILLRSSKDFDFYVNVTRTRKVNIYTSLIIFSSENKTLMNICKDPQKNYFNLVFNVKMLVVCHHESLPIREWYSLYPNKTEVVDYATWSFDGGFIKLNNKSFYERRNSLKGISLRVTSIKNETTERLENLTGYFGDVMSLIAEKGEFTIERQELEEVYGVYNPETNKWNGIMEKLINNETDIGLGEFSMTESRLQVVDFSDPIIVTLANYYIKKPNDKVLHWSMYYKAFGKKGACILIMLVISVPLLIGYITLKSNEMYNKQNCNNNFLKIIHECYLDVMAIFCTRPLTSFTEVSSLRIAYFSLYIFSFMLSSVYSAILTSYLTVFKPDLPFNSLKDFIRDGSYKLTVIRNSSFIDEYKNSKDPLIHKLKDFLLKEEELPSYAATAIQQICNGRKIILCLGDYSLYTNHSHLTCELEAFEKSHLMNMAFAFPKDSPYVGFFNYYLQTMRAHGILQNLRIRNMRVVKTFELNYEPVTLWSSMPVFVVLAFGISLSLVILICENIYSCATARKHEFAKSKTNYWKPLIRPVN